MDENRIDEYLSCLRTLSHMIGQFECALREMQPNLKSIERFPYETMCRYTDEMKRYIDNCYQWIIPIPYHPEEEHATEFGTIRYHPANDQVTGFGD